VIALLIITAVVAIITVTALALLLGFGLGSPHRDRELLRVRLQAADAARRMHDLTREAFVAMAEHVDQRRNH
jgi:hypothetical protein